MNRWSTWNVNLQEKNRKKNMLKQYWNRSEGGRGVEGNKAREFPLSLCAWVRVCVCACVCAMCVRALVNACLCACACVRACIPSGLHTPGIQTPPNTTQTSSSVVCHALLGTVSDQIEIFGDCQLRSFTSGWYLVEHSLLQQLHLGQAKPACYWHKSTMTECYFHIFINHKVLNLYWQNISRVSAVIISTNNGMLHCAGLGIVYS